ncbi:DUF4262 domain-containing protein [Jiangella mangrovi]|nr:DUF4262 domain-containing protein [Jiangella mangrovi]
MAMGETHTPVQLQQWLDQEDAWMRETVRRHGWAVQYVDGDGCWGPPRCGCGRPRGGSPPFAYTVGLFGYDHAELLVYGLGQHAASSLLNELGEQVRQGEQLGSDRPLRVDGGPHLVVLVPFRDDGDTPVLISAQRFYQATRDRPVPALRVVWSDAGGRFPWEHGYDLPAGLQPSPG